MVLLLLAGLTAATATAHAGPPDPLWIAGVYDGADSDDAIVLVVSAEATGPSSDVALLPDLPLAGGPTASPPSQIPLATFRSAQDRAPPSA